MQDIGSINSTLPTPSTESSNRRTLSQDEFFQIMITELTNQDPLEPMDNSEFLNQVSQLQSLETMTRLSEGIESLLLGQQVTSAASLIGKSVIGISVDGQSIEGLVTKINVDGDDVTVGIGNVDVPLNRVLEVHGASTNETETPEDTP